MNNPYQNRLHRFEDVVEAASRITKKYTDCVNKSASKQWAIYAVVGDIYLLALTMQQEGKIPRIHNSCICRLQSTRMQQRNSFAVVMLLLQLLEPNHFNRYKRYRVSKALQAAQIARVPHTHLATWIRSQGGFERFKGRSER